MQRDDFENFAHVELSSSFPQAAKRQYAYDLCDEEPPSQDCDLVEVYLPHQHRGWSVSGSKQPPFGVPPTQ